MSTNKAKKRLQRDNCFYLMQHQVVGFPEFPAKKSYQQNTSYRMVSRMLEASSADVSWSRDFHSPRLADLKGKEEGARVQPFAVDFDDPHHIHQLQLELSPQTERAMQEPASSCRGDGPRKTSRISTPSNPILPPNISISLALALLRRFRRPRWCWCLDTSISALSPYRGSVADTSPIFVWPEWILSWRPSRHHQHHHPPRKGMGIAMLCERINVLSSRPCNDTSPCGVIIGVLSSRWIQISNVFLLCLPPISRDCPFWTAKETLTPGSSSSSSFQQFVTRREVLTDACRRASTRWRLPQCRSMALSIDRLSPQYSLHSMQKNTPNRVMMCFMGEETPELVMLGCVLCCLAICRNVEKTLVAKTATSYTKLRCSLENTTSPHIAIAPDCIFRHVSQVLGVVASHFRILVIVEESLNYSSSFFVFLLSTLTSRITPELLRRGNPISKLVSYEGSHNQNKQVLSIILNIDSLLKIQHEEVQPAMPSQISRPAGGIFQEGSQISLPKEKSGPLVNCPTRHRGSHNHITF
ncbi:hypothetical protein HYFRA_00009234 [Hymenoscyphus fraxineus]|uniref:Uncharacterized protein n=1 Tax=Hymenoscyphus fraxineus TaxID=746836 RepID=A0A9N9KTT6_9HELO|nr:hypothetical protein HYFRA_00009234 [Hymenoscyphus fraxineus]